MNLGSAEPINEGCLQDGRKVVLNQIGPDDKEDLLDGFDELSSKTRYLRFFSVMPTLPEHVVRGLLNTDVHSNVAVGARLVGEDGHKVSTIVGVARFFRLKQDAHVAEPAIVVVDDLHGLGLGTLLIGKLMTLAIPNNITHFRAHVLRDNRRMRSLLKNLDGKIVASEDMSLIYDVDICHVSEFLEDGLADLLEMPCERQYG